MISLDKEQALKAAVASADASADRAEAAAPGVVSSAWSWIINADSAAAAARNGARQARSAADQLRAKVAALLSDPSATDEEADRLLGIALDQAVGSLAVTVEDTASHLTPGAAVAETAAGVAADARGALPVVGVGVVVVVVAVVLLVLRDARRGARA